MTSPDPSPLEADLKAAPFAALTAHPVSGEALGLCAALCREAMTLAEQKPLKSRIEAFGALAADLIERGPEQAGGWLYRTLSPNSFTGSPVGYRPFLAVFESAVMAELVQVVEGQTRYAPSDFAATGWAPVRGQATRFRASEALRERFASQGITTQTWADHFVRTTTARLTIGPALELRAGKSRMGNAVHKGRVLPIRKDDPHARPILWRVERVNAFLAAQTFDPLISPVRLKRIFNDGDNPAHGWRQGGRLYGPHTNLKKKTERAAIRINGEATKEIDLRAAHLSILVALGHLPLSLIEVPDPYAVGGIPRLVVKQWVTMTLSHGKRHRAWPKGAVAELAKDGIDLRRDFPVTPTGDAILKALPIIGGDGSGVPVGWGELQYRESEVILSALETLAFEHGVPCLPVHDSLVVPEGAKELAIETLKESFRDSLGVVPVID